VKALLLENIHPDSVGIFTSGGFEVDRRAGSLLGDDLVSALADVTLLGIRSNTKLTAKVIEAAPDCLLAIGAFCIGTNQIALEAARARGIAVFNAPYSNTRSVVELAIAEIVALSRRLGDKTGQMHKGVWNKSADGSHEVRGKTLGIVGYGNIGSQLSIVAEALGMHVVFYDIADKLALSNARHCDSLDELLGESDFVTLHVDGRPGNAGFFGRAQIDAMKDGSALLNLSRGFVIDVDALADALRSGHLSGAAIDVYPREPENGQPFVSPLQGLTNVILTPHVGGSTLEAQVDIAHFVSNKLLDYVTAGTTVMSVNLPNVAAPPIEGHRVALVHRNVPGVMAQLNAALAEHQANIGFQSLATQGEVGYVLTDVTYDIPGLTRRLQAMRDTIRVRIL